MARVLLMPALAANETQATLTAWSVAPGESFAAGAALAEVETDKATVELPAEEGGVMGEQLVAPGEEVAVGAPICVLLAVGEEAPATVPVAAAAKPVAAKPAAAPEPPPGRVFSSPLARRHARERGVDLSELSGRGPNGRIVRRDVDAAAATPPPAPVPVATDTSVPHSRMRQAIARRLSESKATVPHFYIDGDVHVDRLLDLRREINDGRPEKISVNDFVVRAAARALVLVPDANVSWTEAAMLRHAHADIAVAVATDNGLLTPIVRAAETKSLSALSSELGDLVERARSGRLQPSEFEGGSLTVSNLGMFGVQAFSAIINPPQAAILAVGAARKAPVVRDDVLGVGTLMHVTMSVDHRAIDGALAAQWFATFVRLLESPATGLV
jgi:pyruvate dehydrogenase E2 component (dihydrolipoamide acetyltransferase)